MKLRRKKQAADDAGQGGPGGSGAGTGAAGGAGRPGTGAQGRPGTGAQGRPGTGAQGRPGGGPQVQKLRKEVEALRQRVALLEQELQESRQLNKRLAEITDVVAEVLLPSDQREDDRLRAALQRYDTVL